MNTADDEDDVWMPVVARCLAYLCLKNSKYATSPVLEQAAFLERLGLPLKDRAGVTGSTVDSLRVLSRRARGKKKAKGNGKTKRR